jgi:hypothetical protein
MVERMLILAFALANRWLRLLNKFVEIFNRDRFEGMAVSREGGRQGGASVENKSPTGGHNPCRDGRHPAVLDISPPDGTQARGSSLPGIAGPDNDLEPLVG